MTLIVIAFGSREWKDRPTIVRDLDSAWRIDRSLVVLEGGARGADRIAGQWAAARRMAGVGWLRIPAEWDTHDPAWCPGWCKARGRSCVGAGPKRNQQMLEYGLDAVAGLGWRFFGLCWKEDFDLTRGTGGTEDMARRLQDHNIPVVLRRTPT